MAKNLKFPAPKDYKPANPAVLCPAERVIRLYNQGTNDNAKRIAKKVRAWFSREAHGRGWAGVYFLPEVQTNFGAGCVLWRAPDKVNISIKVTEKVLVLQDLSGD